MKNKTKEDAEVMILDMKNKHEEEILRLKGQIEVMKQLMYKSKGDEELSKWNNNQKDISFLKEIKSKFKKAFEDKDVVSKDMGFKMLEDWIHELEKNNI